MTKCAQVQKIYQDKNATDKKYVDRLYGCYCNNKKTCVTSSGIYYTKRNAIVKVVARVNTDNTGEPVVYQYGLGFLIEYCHRMYIVTSASNVLYRGPDQRVPAPADPNFVPVNTVYVTVYQVNGTNMSPTYQTEIIGIDGSNDIALLQISRSAEFNRCLPKLDDKKHPYFCWGRSRKYMPGQEVYAFSNPNNNDNRQVLSGTLMDNKFVRSDSTYHFEGVSTDLNLDAGSDRGTPVIDKCGDVIGVYSYSEQFNDSTGFMAVGVAEHLARFIIRAFLHGINGELGQMVDIYTDTLTHSPCGLFVFNKGYYGMSWHLFGTLDLINIIDTYGPVDKYNNVQGIVLDSLDPNSPLVPTFEPLLLAGDVVVIESINCCPLGNIDEQVGPTAISNRCPPESKVKLSYRLGSENLRCSYEVKLALIDYPTAEENPTSTFA